MNPTLKLGLMVVAAYTVLYAVAYISAELIDRLTKDK